MANRTSRRMNVRAPMRPRRTQTIVLASSDGPSGLATSCRLTVVLMPPEAVSVATGGMSDGVSSPTGIMEVRVSSASSGTLASSMAGRGGSGNAGMGRVSLDGMEGSGPFRPSGRFRRLWIVEPASCLSRLRIREATRTCPEPWRGLSFRLGEWSSFHACRHAGPVRYHASGWNGGFSACAVVWTVSSPEASRASRGRPSTRRTASAGRTG